MKNKKTNQNNILIIAAIIFVVIAVIFFVIALSLFNNSGTSDSGNSVPSVDIGSSSDNSPQSSSSLGSSSQESRPSSVSSSTPESSSQSTPQSSSQSSSSTQSSSQSRPQSSVQSSSAPQSSSAGSVDLSLAQKIVENARQLIGTPFKDGGIDPDGFDSSGFIYYVMRESGFASCPRDIALQAKMGVIREYDELKEGDLVFFSNDIGGSPNFAGFYSGDGKMIGCLVASSFEGVVEVNITNNYYKTHFVSGVGIS